MRTSKRLFAACAFFICSALAGYAGQFGDFTYVEYVRNIEITDYPEDATGDVIIPSEIVGKPVKIIGQSAFRSCRSLTSVAIPDSVTSIGQAAFVECSNLTSVTIGNGVTSIGDYAFALCGSLTSVAIPDSVTSIGEDAFRDCHSLTAIQVDAANSAFSSVDGVMFNKSQTTLITFPSGKAGSYAIPDGVTSIGDGAFRGCQSLTAVTIPDNVISIGGIAFGACTSLIAVTIGNGVISIGAQAFYLCISLKSVTIGAGVTSIGDRAFAGCSNLDAVTFEGDAPDLGSSVFGNSYSTTVYYLSGTTGWGPTFGLLPTEEISALPDPLIGGIPIYGSEGWFLSEWFGVYNTAFAPWIFHAEHGVIFRLPESTGESTYFYDISMGSWWWTNQTFYPFIYAFDPPVDIGGTDVGDAWLFYFENSKTPRSFVVMTGESAGSFLFFNP